MNKDLIETFKSQKHRKVAYMNDKGAWQFHKSEEFNKAVTREEALGDEPAAEEKPVAKSKKKDKE